MERDPVESLLPELAEWAEKREQPVQGNSDDAEMLLRLLNDYIGVADLSELQPVDLNALLLSYYPQKVVVESDEDLSTVIATVRELLTFAADTGRLSAKQASGLQKKVDEIEPRFADAVMDPANWGIGRQIGQAMSLAGVDPGNEEELSRWIDEYNARLDVDAELSDEESLDLRDALGLPDRLPPLRVPSDEDLAAEARRSPLLDRVRRLALWVGERAVEGAQLLAADVIPAAEALGLPVPDEVTELADIPELASLWDLAFELEFTELTPTTVEPGPAVEDWPDGTDEVVLDIWADALVLLTRKNFQDEEEELDLADVTTFTMVTLFLARNEGVPVAELRDMIQHIATAELVQPAAWSYWVESHGDPAERIFARLTDLGAAQVSEGIVRLTPLGQYTYATALTEGGIEVPLLPPVEEMTAVDLMDFARGASDDEMAAETDAWLAARGKAAATDELLTAAAAGDAEERMIAIAIAGPIAAAAPDRWRQALDEPALRPYAKLTLHQLGAAGPELESTVTDAAWLLTDMLGAALAMDSGDQDELPDILAGAVPAGQEPKIFEAIWRLDHPNAREVLTMIGAQHPDKKIAKAARKAALKIRPST